MKPKQVLILGIILGLLIVAVTVKQMQKPPELVTEEYIPLDLSFEIDKVQKVQVGKGDAAPEGKPLIFTIVKDELAGWRIPDFQNARADEEKTRKLLKDIREAKGELRAKDKSLLADFKIDDKQAYRIGLYDKDWTEILTLYIGAKLAGNDLLFIRKSGSDSVYVTNAFLLGDMGIFGEVEKQKPEISYWAATNLVRLNVDKVNRIETAYFRDGKPVFTTGVQRSPGLTAEDAPGLPGASGAVRSLTGNVLARSAGAGGGEAKLSRPLTDSTIRKWSYLRPEVPFALDMEKIKQFLGSLGNGRASKVLDSKAGDYGFSSPKWQMKIGMEGGEEVVIKAGNTDPDTKGVYMQVSSEGVVFLLPDYYFKNFNIDDSRFFVANPLEIVSDKIEKLVIHTPEKELKFNPKEKKTDALTSYLNNLMNFAATRLLFDPGDRNKVRAGGRYWMEIQQENEPPTIIDVGDVVPAREKEYAAQKRDRTQAFAISEGLFKKLFENLDRLSSPQT